MTGPARGPAARVQVRTDEFKQAYPTRSAIERIIAWTATCNGRRIRLRYTGAIRAAGHRHSDTPRRSQTGIQRSIRRNKRLTPKRECVGVSLPPTECSYGRDAEE